MCLSNNIHLYSKNISFNVNLKKVLAEKCVFFVMLKMKIKRKKQTIYIILYNRLSL